MRPVQFLCMLLVFSVVGGCGGGDFSDLQAFMDE
ncbi:pilus assembly protein PilP, partial [Salmonella enterica subsp. enterica]|nr:pilus assembly protein PilP [Salmonella enterica subsp. enterica serovar Javiana]